MGASISCIECKRVGKPSLSRNPFNVFLSITAADDIWLVSIYVSPRDVGDMPFPHSGTSLAECVSSADYKVGQVSIEHN